MATQLLTLEDTVKTHDITHQSDFDGCIIRGPLPTINSHALLHFYGALDKLRNSDARKAADFLRYGFECVYGELTKRDNTNGLRSIARLLQGIEFREAVDFVARRIKPKEGSLERAREMFPEGRLVLGIISNNDPDLIRELNNKKLQYELEQWDIVIDNNNIIGNLYPKYGGRYNGSIEILVGPNKPKHFLEGLVYLADFTDYRRYRHYRNVIRI